MYQMTGTVKKATEKAVMLSSKEFPQGEWFPKSQMIAVSRATKGQPEWTVGEVLDTQLKNWIAEQKGLKVEKSPEAVKQEAEMPCEEGVYLSPDGAKIFRVKIGQESKKPYAMELIEIGGRRLTEIGEVINADWEYRPGSGSASITASICNLYSSARL